MQNWWEQDSVAQPAPSAPTNGGIIRPRVDPYKARDQQLQEEAAQRAREDQALQRQKFEIEQQKATLDIQKSQRDLAPGADTTESEKTAGFLATRVAGGLKELQRITSQNKDAAKPTFGVEAVRSIFGDTAANYLTDADRQQVVAAQRDILDAALTLGTGAAYTAEQLEGYRQAYFPQLGDDDATIKGKQQRLQQLLESAKVKAGRSAPLIDQALTAAGIGAVRDVSALQQAFDSGASLEEIMQLAQQTGTPTPVLEDLIAAIRFRDQGGTGARILPPDNSPPDNNGGGLGEAFYAGVGDVAQGVGEALGLVANPLNAGINAIAGTNLSTDLGQTFRDATGAPQGDPLASAINRAGTSVLTTAGISGLARPVAQGAGQFVADAFAQQPVRRAVAEGTNTVARTLSQEPIRQAVGGASAGAAAEVARQAGANPLLQAAAGLAGGVGGYGAAGIPQALMRPQQANSLLQVAQPANSRLIPNAQQVVDDGRAINTRVMTSDIRPPKTRMGKMLRNIGDSIPIAGTAGPRAGQQTERVDAVQKLMKEFGADETAIEAVSKDLIKTRGEAIKKLTTAKDSVIKNIKGEVPAPKAIAEIDKQIAKLTGIDEEAFKPVINRLNGFKTALQSGKTLEQVEGQRRLLGDLFADASLASIKGDGQKAINAIYNPLKEDMAAFIEATAGPAAKAKWAGANERLAAMAGELDASAFKSLLNNAETTPESAAKIIFGKTPSDMKRLYGSLSDKGKAKAQSAIMFQALEKSTSNDMISPQKFATAMEAMSKATGVFFSPADKARIDGITRLIKATQHASDAAANPMTGAQNTPLIAGLSIGQIFGTAALPVTAAAGLLARVYESAPVRDAFLRLGRTKAGSPQEQGAMARALTAIAAANDNPEIAAFAQTAPGSARAAASEGQEEREERPIKP